MLPLEHGGNCFLYKNADDLVAQVESLLKQKERLVAMGRELSKQVHGTNNIYSVGRNMLYRYIDKSGTEEKTAPLSLAAETIS